ncbi:unnamed protein product [Vitrella brassicaformis CCMP3155]|uniref:Uncharacterized protein n=1 Tax=Vitrella brassicaformis (strain CCMP3155) TaxID=1169540 RepID=A0A0G4EXN7_VITBC|nr:unnamed protein product [Vitrella brassicaformis CCMP3155]|eukprot:CEM03374.1 unnamed protein product [Vitrella brassicaformis CCMP3155]
MDLANNTNTTGQPQLAGVRTEADLRRAVADHLHREYGGAVGAVQGRSAEDYELELDFNQFDRRGLSAEDP